MRAHRVARAGAMFPRAKDGPQAHHPDIDVIQAAEMQGSLFGGELGDAVQRSGRRAGALLLIGARQARRREAVDGDGAEHRQAPYPAMLVRLLQNVQSPVQVDVDDAARVGPFPLRPGGDRRRMHDAVYRAAGKRPTDIVGAGHVSNYGPCRLPELLQGVGRGLAGIEEDDVLAAGEQLLGDREADEACASGDKNGHGRSLSGRSWCAARASRPSGQTAKAGRRRSAPRP